MTSRRLAKTTLAAAITVLIVSVVGFVVALVLNLFFLDKYNAYGEVPIPGSGSVTLPAGDVTISFHTVVIGSPSGGGLPVPRMGLTITPPDGAPQPTVTESVGSTTTVNNDAHIRVWVAHVAAAGTYGVTTDGQVNGYIDPRLAFGHQTSYGFVVWLFVGLFVAALVATIVLGRWLARQRRRPVAPTVAEVAAPYEPSDEGVRLQRLKTLAALRDSGALTGQEFEDEKRRILEGN